MPVVLVQALGAAPKALAQAAAALAAQAQAPGQALDQVAPGPVPVDPNLGSSHSWPPGPVGHGPWRHSHLMPTSGLTLPLKSSSW